MDIDRWKLNQIVAELATSDPGFREALTLDPRKALADLLEQPTPASLEVKVLDEMPGTLYLVLPPAASGAQELSDEDLESVAGGGLPGPLPRPAQFSLRSDSDLLGRVAQPLALPFTGRAI